MAGTKRKWSGSTSRLVAIGASAGGFDALKSLVAQLPEDFAAVIFIVLHMAGGG